MLEKILTILKLFLGGSLATIVVVDILIYKTPNVWIYTEGFIVLVLLTSGIVDILNKEIK